MDNSCRTYLGGRSGIHGTASVRSDASLRVNFSGIPFQNENGPVNYRVTYLAEDYSSPLSETQIVFRVSFSPAPPT